MRSAQSLTTLNIRGIAPAGTTLKSKGNMRIIDVTISSEGDIKDVDFVAWIMNEIEDKVYTRKHVAKTYAILLQKNTPHETMVEINKAIIKRWSPSGFRWIKERAWKIATREAEAALEA